METKIQTFEKIFSNGFSCIVPAYQREYSWDKGQLEFLFEDIRDFLQLKIKKKLFLGFLIFFQSSAIDKNLKIVDGKQRIITLSLFVMFIVQKLKLAKNADKKLEFEKLEKIIAWRPNAMNLYLYQKEDQKIYSNIWKCVKENESINQKREWKSNSIWKNFKEIENFVESNPEKDIPKILEFITKKINFLSIFINQNDRPQKIFETLNSTGKESKVSDLVKNYILSNLVQCSEKDIEDKLEIYWDKWVKLLLKNSEKKETGLEVFFDTLTHIVSNIKQLSLPGLNKNQKIFKSFKSFFREFKFLEKPKDIEPYLKWLEKFIIIYLLISNNELGENLENLTTWEKIKNKSHILKISKNNRLKCFGWENKILSLFFSLLLARNIVDRDTFKSLIEFATIYEMILRIWKNIGQLSKEYSIFITKIKSRFKMEEDYIFGRPKSNNLFVEPNNNHKKEILNYFAKLLKEKLEKEKELFQDLKNLKNESKFEEEFIKNITKKLKKNNLLQITASILRLTTKTFDKIKKPTIEHIFPQKPIKNLKTQSVQIENIGNLIFLEDKINEKCQNKKLTEKIKIWKESENIEVRVLIKDIEQQKIQEWDKKQIQKREAIKLKEFVQKIKSSGFLEYIFNEQ